MQQTNEANAETETQPAAVEDRIRNFSTYFKLFHAFLYFLLIK